MIFQILLVIMLTKNNECSMEKEDNFKSTDSIIDRSKKKNNFNKYEIHWALWLQYLKIVALS